MITPDQAKLLLKLGILAALVAGGFAGGWTLNGWRLGEKIATLEGQLQHERDQAKILAGGLEACNAGVDAVSKAGDDVLKLAGQLIDAAKKVHAGGKATADRLEELIKKGTPPGAGCDKAWDAIEADRADSKARGP